MLDLREIAYYTANNPFYGSEERLRFLLKPNLEENTLLAYTWQEDVCFDLAKDPLCKTFPLTQQGLEEANAYLTALAQELGPVNQW